MLVLLEIPQQALPIKLGLSKNSLECLDKTSQGSLEKEKRKILKQAFQTKMPFRHYHVSIT